MDFYHICLYFTDTIVIGCIEHNESYDVITDRLAPVIADINEVEAEGKIDVDGTPVAVQLYLCSDYKV